MTASSGAQAPQRFFAAAARGTEDALVRELVRLGVESTASVGGVSFVGDLTTAYTVCLWSRVATRVTVELNRGEVATDEELYELVSGVPWEEHLHLDRTFSVEVAGRHDTVRSTRYAALKTKDAIVDRLRDRLGRRPDVDPDNPDQRVHLFLGAAVVVGVELAGAMHRRGYRSPGARAPLRETLAAALLELAEWDEEMPLLDPMCGSGTIAIEAGLRRLRVAPGLLRNPRGPAAWLGHDQAAWNRVVEEAEAARRTLSNDEQPPVLASDAVYKSVRAARESVDRLGLTGVVVIARWALMDAAPPDGSPGLVVTNPPYGERIGVERELMPLYQQLGDVLKRRFGGWTAWVLSGSPTLSKHIGLRPATRRVLFNGAIECRFLQFPIKPKEGSTSRGPGWRKPSEEALMFANRLRKNLRRLEPWAKREGIEAYRIYDHDIPEFNVSVDAYGGRVRVEEEAPPRHVKAADADRHLQDVLLTVSDVLHVPPDLISLRVRARRERDQQDGLRGDHGHRFAVEERGARFLVNLDDYLDTGLYLDDRILRHRIRKAASGKRFLNLFAYTCSASVAAAVGGAAQTTSVDRSARYLDWGRANFEENKLPVAEHRFVTADALVWLRDARKRGEQFDLVYCSPPTFARSKDAHDFDVVRDHPGLIEAIGRVLAPSGAILFATNKQGFAIAPLQAQWNVQPLGRQSVPRDFSRRAPHAAFWLTSPGS